MTRTPADTLNPSTEGPGISQRRAFRYHSTSPVRFLVTQHDKTLLYLADGKKSLYDSAADPREVADIYDSRDADLAVLWEELGQDLDRVLEYLPHLQRRGRGL
jgi:hypothetical protein